MPPCGEGERRMRIGADSGGSVREGSRSGFTAKLTDVMPILPFLAFGFFLAWSQVSLQGVLVLPQPTVAAPGIPLRSISSLVNGITMIAVAFTVVSSGKVLSRNWAIILCGGIVGLCSIVPLCLADAGMSYEQAYPLWFVAEILRGAASALVFLKIARLYSRLSGRACIMYLGFSHVLAACLFYITIGVDEPIATGSANTTALWLGNALLPLLAAMTATLEPPANMTVYRSADTHSGDIHTLPSSFWRFVVFIFVLSLVMALTSSAGAAASPRFLNLIRIVVALIIVWSAASYNPQRFKLGKTYVGLIVFAIAIVALTPVASGIVPGWSTLASASMLLFRMLHWVVLCLIVCQRRISSLLVFGFGAGVQAIGTGLGGIIPGLVPFPAGTNFSLVLSMVCIVLVIACAFLIFSEKELDLLFVPANSDDVEYEDLFGPIVKVGSATVAEPPVAEAEEQEAVNTKAVIAEHSQEEGVFTTAANPDADDEPRRYRRSFNEAIEICTKRYNLSSREIDVFRYLAMGYNAQAIADKLFISWNTVRSHSRNIYAKLDAHSRSELMDLVSAVREE